MKDRDQSVWGQDEKGPTGELEFEKGPRVSYRLGVVLLNKG